MPQRGTAGTIPACLEHGGRGKSRSATPERRGRAERGHRQRRARGGEVRGRSARPGATAQGREGAKGKLLFPPVPGRRAAIRAGAQILAAISRGEIGPRSGAPKAIGGMRRPAEVAGGWRAAYHFAPLSRALRSLTAISGRKPMPVKCHTPLLLMSEKIASFSGFLKRRRFFLSRFATALDPQGSLP